ncbi:ANTAR domain-containing protein [Streptomyces roseirectus]|uniref:ANTAR domain-containing protein n=1 Tax=Streptomyces roseirectus TaxID=2768066 RepID=A0A7H0INK5_9ACTN|nr:ANTAR domain-containing protein [Streptomyces roseirectus]QNP74371.1 ANTAR domain-containing protein [Streptomyces roseirectus]
MPNPPDEAQRGRATPTLSTRRDGDRIVVTVAGELCLDDSGILERTLRAALREPVTRVELDLEKLEFWDCSALNVLLTARRQALADGKELTVTAASPAAERLLSLTDTRPLLVEEREKVDDELRTEVVQLRRAMQTRPEIDLARGILMASFGLSPDEAWEVLVMASQNTNTKLHRLASTVVTTVQGTPLPDPVRRHLTEAVASVSAPADTGEAPPRTAAPPPSR